MESLFAYIAASPTAYQAAAHSAELLEKAGYIRLSEGAHWVLEPGKGYFVTRNGSSLVAFRLPEALPAGFMIAAAHLDSPTFKIKENAELEGGGYIRLSVEKYGGMLCASWMDRPLSVAGRVLLRTESGVRSQLVDFKKPVALIPNVAIHMNRKANDGFAYNPAVDMLPLYAGKDKAGAFFDALAALAGCKKEDILSHDLFLYNPEAGVEWGDFVSAPRLDDLQCAYSALTALLDAQDGSAIPVCALFDNEEVGSTTKQGAASTFLADLLSRIASSLELDEEEKKRLIASSLMVSCDNAHAVHPNHPEFSDKNHTVTVNGGIVIKYNANQKYTSDAVSAALFRLLCEKACVPVQLYANRADMAGGSTLGNISNTQVSLNTVDIGIAQLAMHSAFETAGREDTGRMVAALKALYRSSILQKGDGVYDLQ